MISWLSGGTSVLWFIIQELIKFQQVDDGHNDGLRSVRIGECTHDIPIGSLSPVLRVLWDTNSKASHEQSVSAVVCAAKMFNTSLLFVDLQAQLYI